ncbi:FkbO/Hyg5 family chorismatase [Nocardia sp. NPDC003482]|uniref:FkbO/Hyg5 family chorismatase n=1 Tax=Nocardia sp. NPDC004068 TaxID=3364303 RepID=UPI0036878D0D
MSVAPTARLWSTFDPVDRVSNDAFTLARIEFGTTSALDISEGGTPVLRIPMSSPGFDEFTETWAVDAPVTAGRYEDLVYAHTDEYLFAAVQIPELDEYAEATNRAYRSAFKLIANLNYPSIFRVWNFVGGIVDANAAGMEIYRDFVAGRAEAFKLYQDGLGKIPAATGIGTRGRGISIALLAARTQRPRHIENGRQLPAYEYPREYGPKSPNFARATVLRDADETTPRQLFVSGTASILGHATVHPGDIRKQTRTVLENIEYLVGQENLADYGLSGHSLSDLRQLKVYVKHAADLEVVRDIVTDAVGGAATARYLNVDVCRDDLLVEIEALIPLDEGSPS